MGPQPSTPPERKPMGLTPDQLSRPEEPSAPEREPVFPDPEQEETAPRVPAYRLNTVAGSGNTTNNPDNNITARTLEEGAGLER